MELHDLAHTLDYGGGSRWVIEDEPLLGWARENSVPPASSQILALEEDIIPLRYLKNLFALSVAEQLHICRGRVFICGCGGLGGVLINLLARAGVGGITAADYDVFAPSNLNRQWLSDVRQLARPKVTTALERVAAINPFVELQALEVSVDSSNAKNLMRGVDLALDAMDNIEGRFVIAEAARRLGIPFIHAAVAGWWGQVSTFLPGSDVGLSSIYGERRLKDPAEDAVGVLGPAAAVVGSLQAFESLRILAGRQPSYVNRLLYFDGESGIMEFLPL
ncbi:MAG: HesA/MoeB/ThiF family protein [Syntrophobacter sp.]